MKNTVECEIRPNFLSIWQDVRSECGYCKGRRVHVLTQKNPKQDEEPEESSESHHEEEEIQRQYSGNNVEIFRAEELSESTSSSSYACNFDSISPMSYQLLIERGFRRSGKLLYKPRNYSSCCPCIPIRLDVKRFQISKSQKKVLRVLSSVLGGDHGGGVVVVHRNTESNTDQTLQLQQSSNKRQRNNEKNTIHSFQNTLPLLQHIIKTCSLMDLLRDELYSYLQGNSQYIKKDDQRLDTKLCEWKVRRIYKPKSHENDAIQCEACVSSSVIPALFRGNFNTSENNQNMLAMNLLAHFQGVDRICKYTHDEVDSDGNVIGSIRVVVPNVSLHEPSGQLNVHLYLILHRDKIHPRPLVPTSTTKLQHDSNQETHHSNKLNCIQGFLQEYGVKESQDIQPPYTLTIKTIPSHISGNMQSVHELYCKYQRIVHGDDDPFHPSLNDSRTEVNEEDPQDQEQEKSCSDENQEQDEYSLSFTDFEKRYPHADKKKLTTIFKRYVFVERIEVLVTFLCIL